MEDKLIDEVVAEVLDKSLIEEITHLYLTPESLERLISEYAEEFEIELLEVGRKASKQDLEDYFNITISVGPIDTDYKLLKEV